MGYRAIVLILVACLAGPIRAADWPHWRGPHYDGISRETDWRSDKLKVLWRQNVQTGFSSVVVSEGRLYTMGNSGSDTNKYPNNQADTVFCLDAETGDILWRHSYKCPLLPRQYEGGPSATPTVAGDRVYTFSKVGDVCCIDAASGRVIWTRSVVGELGVETPGWGFAGSPVVWNGRVILSAGESGLALDAATGKVIWQNGRAPCGYSTAVPFQTEGRDMLALLNATALVGVKPDTGEVMWRIPWPTKDGFNMADPVIAGDLTKTIFISSGYRQGCAKIIAACDRAEVVWKTQAMRNHLATCVLLDGYLYGMDYYTLACVDHATGEVKWTHRGLGQGSLTASIDGRLIILGEKGQLVIARANPAAFEPLVEMQPITGRCWTVPVLANGRIYLRNAVRELVCLEARK
ncbi:MAG TPA: PQQ-like beta-propeller repeat protein [Anaerohalosphaeraceae bacterium]|nr:PQQ-like beta-propeller repeat protein [Anaerohalosphaeraceae bacterium]HRT49176.1 PQQ-like beta-propeller repeat protein [Anaerohalosphaeraceae bacterium]HRT85285.1 PQQ-like beta-propeller repeat protein [Anaerohalosphaeraceae bacterium]